VSTSRWPKIGPVSVDDTCRLVSGSRARELDQGLEDLGISSQDMATLLRLWAVTDARLQAQYETHRAGIDRTSLVFGTQLSRLVNQTFANPGRSTRFGVPGRAGVWYCARELDTAVAEVAHHRIAYLAEIDRPDEEDIVCRLVLADVHGERFADLRDRHRQSTMCLDPSSYRASQAFAERLWADHGEGVVYPSVRRRRGVCFAVLRSPVLSRLRRANSYRLVIQDYRLAEVEDLGA